ncbi:hypothetical protein BH09ACT10_BH09ACT10_29800 [soil metagenome]
MPYAEDVPHEGIAWPPTLVIDLRSPGELEPEHPLISRGAHVQVIPLLAALDPTKRWEGNLYDLYLRLLDEAQPMLVELVELVAEKHAATLIHCAAGKDRTGITVGLLLRLVGVDRADVISDYLLTVAAEQDILDRLNRSVEAGHRAAVPPRTALEVPDHAMEAVMDVWDKHPGGTEGWIIDAGASPDIVERLRAALLEA